MTCTVFSLNFSSAGKGPFMASETKKNVLEAHFPGGGEGVVERGTWLQSHCEIWGLSSLKHHSLIYPNQLLLTLVKQFKMFDSNNLTLSSMLSFQNAWPLCILRYTSIYSFITLQDRIGSQLEYFLK